MKRDHSSRIFSPGETQKLTLTHTHALSQQSTTLSQFKCGYNKMVLDKNKGQKAPNKPINPQILFGIKCSLIVFHLQCTISDVLIRYVLYLLLFYIIEIGVYRLSYVYCIYSVCVYFGWQEKRMNPICESAAIG